jgi:hypothetical protein
MHHSEVEKSLPVHVRPAVSLGGRVEEPRTMFIGPIVGLDGTDSYVPCPIGHSEGGELKLTEQQFRQLANRMGEIMEVWDFADDDFGK